MYNNSLYNLSEASRHKVFLHTKSLLPLRLEFVLYLDATQVAERGLDHRAVELSMSLVSQRDARSSPTGFRGLEHRAVELSMSLVSQRDASSSPTGFLPAPAVRRRQSCRMCCSVSRLSAQGQSCSPGCLHRGQSCRACKHRLQAVSSRAALQDVLHRLQAVFTGGQSCRMCSIVFKQSPQGQPCRMCSTVSKLSPREQRHCLTNLQFVEHTMTECAVTCAAEITQLDSSTGSW